MRPIFRALTGMMLLSLFASPLRAMQAESSREHIEARFTEGHREFAAGVELAAKDATAARERFAKAAAAWRTIVIDGGIRNAELERNIGNASLLAGDAPRAIAAFRRARSVDPRDSAALDGLAAARRAAGTEAYAPGATVAIASEASSTGWRGVIGSVWRLAGGVLDWLSTLMPPRWLLWTVATCHVAGWLLLALRLAGVDRVRRWMPAATLAAGAIAIMPLIAADVRRWRSPEAVVVATGITARQGPAEMYEASFKEPLIPGLEVVIAEERGEWVMIRLHDGRSAWVRSTGLERL